MSTATIHPTITTTDRNTLRPIIWNVDYSAEASDKVREQYGWTHFIAISRPKGRRVYAIWAEVIGDVIVRHSEPTKAL